MNITYRKWLQLAESRVKENKNFIGRLKKAKPRDLDKICHQLHEEAFEEIDCLQCANCCFTTGPLLLSKDVDRMAKAVGQKAAQFTEQYLKMDEDKDIVFKHMPCPFLGKDHYCNVYEARPNACREFPHTQQRDVLQKLDITFKNTLICPAVAKIVEELKTYYKAKI